MLDNFLKPRFTDHFDLPAGSFWTRMKYHGYDCDVYFWDNGGPTDDYMARYGNAGHEYLSGTVDGLLRQTHFESVKWSKIQIIDHLNENLRIGRAYLEYKGLVPEDPTRAELREANQ